MTLIEVASKFLEMIKQGYDYTYDYLDKFAGIRFRQSGIIRLHKTGQFLQIKIDHEENNREHQTFLDTDKDVLKQILYIISGRLNYLRLENLERG